MPVKVMRLPARTADATRIIVAVGEYASAQQAQEAASKFSGVTIASIYEDKAVAREGQVRLLGESGSILATDAQRLRLVPLGVAESSMGFSASRRTSIPRTIWPRRATTAAKSTSSSTSRGR